MGRDFYDPTPEEQVVILVESALLRKAEHLIASCEHCNMEYALLPFDAILDRITGADPSMTDYIFEEPANCPICRSAIFEKTLVEPTQTVFRRS